MRKPSAVAANEARKLARWLAELGANVTSYTAPNSANEAHNARKSLTACAVALSIARRRLACAASSCAWRSAASAAAILSEFPELEKLIKLRLAFCRLCRCDALPNPLE